MLLIGHETPEYDPLWKSFMRQSSACPISHHISPPTGPLALQPDMRTSPRQAMSCSQLNWLANVITFCFISPCIGNCCHCWLGHISPGIGRGSWSIDTISTQYIRHGLLIKLMLGYKAWVDTQRTVVGAFVCLFLLGARQGDAFNNCNGNVP